MQNPYKGLLFCTQHRLLSHMLLLLQAQLAAWLFYFSALQSPNLLLLDSTLLSSCHLDHCNICATVCFRASVKSKYYHYRMCAAKVAGEHLTFCGK